MTGMTRIAIPALVAACLLVTSFASSDRLHATPTADRVHLIRLPAGAIQPEVAIDSRGRIHAIYFKGDAAHGDLLYSTIDEQGRFSSPMPINSQAGSGLATGSMRGAHLAIGKSDRVHVAWLGSDLAMPRTANGGASMLYTRMNDARTAFEPQRSVVQLTQGLDGGSIAADPYGHVYVSWHGGLPAFKGEADRRTWVAHSSDDGRTFVRETAANDIRTGTCGCCGTGTLAAREGTLYLLYRSATETLHRDTYLLISRDHGASFTGEKLQDWNVGACPMSTFALAEARDGILAAWETGGQVEWTRVEPRTGAASAIAAAPGAATNRKHPAIAGNAQGETLLAWAENTGWNKGGSLAWQIYDKDGRATSEHDVAPGIPVWSLVAVASRPNGAFMIVY
jgi:hypothetical protein